MLHGCLSIGNPFIAEIMAAQGYDVISIDWQHGALDCSDVLPMFQAMRASGVTNQRPRAWGKLKIVSRHGVGYDGRVAPWPLRPTYATALVRRI